MHCSRTEVNGTFMAANGKANINALAYADDMAVVGRNQETMKVNLAVVERFCVRTGLSLNVKKCAIFHIKPSPELWRCDETVPFFIGGQQVPWLEVLGDMGYLGARINPWFGCRIADPLHQLKDWMAGIQRSPLKGWQKDYLLVGHIIPKLQYALSAARPSLGLLKSLDALK